MNSHQREYLKSGVLALLVILSFVFSIYLWYSAPASEVLRPDNDVPPYIFKNPIYNNRASYELMGPSSMVLHQRGHASIIHPESPSYKKIIQALHQITVGRGKEIHPTRKEWQFIVESTGIELLFPHEVSSTLIESFFDQGPLREPSLTIQGISRLWLFGGGPKGKAWLISDKNQHILEVPLDMSDIELGKIVAANQEDSVEAVATTFAGPLPWEGNGTPFSRVFYLPAKPFSIKQLSFSIENINIDNMKQWLFRDPDIRPLIPNSDESFYMYNDQLLNYNRKFNYMTYNDSSSIQGEGLSLPNQLDQIKNFMQRHQGWTGYYLLDDIQKEEQFLFRLYKQGFPVYWVHTNPLQPIHPDVIQLQTGSSGVSKYIRSMYYLSGKPIQGKSILLSTKNELIHRLNEKRIPLGSIQQIHPGYRAKETTVAKKKQITLDPIWVLQVNGKMILLDAK